MTSAIPRQLVRARPHDPPTDRRLAAIHLRMGQLGLARAELEALAGTGGLDDRSLLTLAEARWRTGDLTGAGEAAQAYLASGGQDVVALVIAAEATSAIGRPTEARRLAGRALERADLPLDRIFAGQRRSAIWPVDTTEPVSPEVTLAPPAQDTPTEVVSTSAEPVETAAPAPAEAAPPPASDGFWDVETIRGEEVPAPRDELETARADLEAGDMTVAAVHLGLVLRLEPDLAADVVELIETLADRTAELELIRGDALRLVGREDDARRAYAAASQAIVRRRSEPAELQEPAAQSHEFEEEQ